MLIRRDTSQSLRTVKVDNSMAMSLAVLKAFNTESMATFLERTYTRLKTHQVDAMLWDEQRLNNIVNEVEQYFRNNMVGQYCSINTVEA